MNRPTPALVSEAGARPLSRWVLLLLCLAYLLPGQWQRDAWRHADLASYGYMAALARGESAWWSPLLAGVPSGDGALLPYWLGAWAMQALPFLPPEQATRLPFVLLLAGVMALVWYAAFHLARTEAAQPAPFAFGGEAAPVDYARTLADAALLALLASLGLLQLGHEASPALAQLLGVSLWLYALAVAPFRPLRAQALALLAPSLLVLAGAPTLAVALSLGGWLVCQYSRFDGARRLRAALLAGALLSSLLAALAQAWAWRLAAPEIGSLLRQLVWFSWPTLPLALLTLWRWRGFLGSRHVSVPLVLVVLALLGWLGQGGSDRALLLALPALAILAALALPTLSRSWSAMVDWFSVFFFSLGALFIWAYYLAMQTLLFPRLAANLQRRAPDLRVEFDATALLLACAATLAWLALVRWRTSRQRAALWRSLALPAGGVVLAWVLLMSLWLAPLNLGRSNQMLLQRLQTLIPADAPCVAAPGQLRSLLATLQAQGRWRVEGGPWSGRCAWQVIALPRGEQPTLADGWQPLGPVERPTDRGTQYWVLKRSLP